MKLKNKFFSAATQRNIKSEKFQQTGCPCQETLKSGFNPVRLIAYILITVFLSGCFGAAFAAGNEEDIIFASQDAQTFAARDTAGLSVAQLDVKAGSAILMDGSSGKVLYEMNVHEKKPPASITKVMTLLLVMEALESGKITPEDKVSASAHACSMGGSQIWLEPNEVMTVDELLRAAVIASANDASVALAEHVAGSEESFVALMNRRASELGMTNSSFKNACGLDEEGHYTTAYDIALMSKELMRYELITRYSTVWMDTLRDGKTALNNTNKLVRFYEGCNGLKTGTTDGARKCISATATRDNLSLIAVTLGSETSDERFDAARKLLDYGFSNFSYFVPQVNKAELIPVKVLHGRHKSVPLTVVGEPGGLIIPKGRNMDVNARTELVNDLRAPVEKGQNAGKVIFSLDNEIIAEIPVVTAAAVEKMTFGNAYNLLVRMLFSLKINPDCRCDKCECRGNQGFCDC